MNKCGEFQTKECPHIKLAIKWDSWLRSGYEPGPWLMESNQYTTGSALSATLGSYLAQS